MTEAASKIEIDRATRDLSQLNAVDTATHWPHELASHNQHLMDARCRLIAAQAAAEPTGVNPDAFGLRPDGNRVAKLIPPPLPLAPLSTLPCPGAVRRASIMLDWLNRLAEARPGKILAEFDPRDTGPAVDAVIDLFRAGVVSAVAWEEVGTGRRGIAVSSLPLDALRAEGVTL